MKRVFVIIAILCMYTTTIHAQTYGDYAKINKEQATSNEAIKKGVEALKSESPVNYEDVSIAGTVDAVCQAKGCWMTMKTEDGTEITIKFKDYAYFMPKDCAGKKFMCHGKLFTKITSVAELKHLATDAGKSKKEIKKIKSPQKELRFEADGVMLM